MLWEIFSLGGSPYPGLPTQQLFSFIEEGKRMDCPEICPKEIYTMMLECWIRTPYNRPTFAQLTERLENFMKQNVDNVSILLDIIA